MNKLLLIALSLSAILSFSSCSDDDEYRIATELNFETEIGIDYDGYFETTIRVTESYIADFRPGREDLLDIETLSSWLKVSHIPNLGRAKFHLIANNNIHYYSTTIAPDYYGESLIDDRDFQYFMIDAIDIIRKKGYVDITIIGESNNGNPLLFTFYNQVDILIRR
ncbi:hypothetical protein [Dysgonomonas sp. 511]|uniref:hypothetical protein n=1 Tax=Dysgonomonas sp. 511 TaxID=2302930 RepID=UPI0013D1802F|nr:hypothetical protein [Dysgonomonas sp. 511]NDV79750.1 hypothetical protein [Dysgonomonas sp. 511]